MTIDEHMVAWRQALHAHPEFGFELQQTATFVATTLRGMGFTDVVEGVGGTGVVATLRRGDGERSIALRADMDALRIHERSDHAHRSRCDGLMHACGHDGHTAMLLGAAKALIHEGGFSGTVRFIFQPAEEWGRGALAMLDDRLARYAGRALRYRRRPAHGSRGQLRDPHRRPRWACLATTRRTRSDDRRVRHGR